MSELDFLDFTVDFTNPQTVSAYDELPLWSAIFGLLLLDEIPLSNALNVLDAGCGTGFPLIELAERLGPTSRVIGVDPWTAALDRAREKMAVRGVTNVELMEGSVVSLPFPGSSFDLVVSNLGLNNFDDPEAALTECVRLMRPGGTLALTTNLQGHMHELYTTFERVLLEQASHEAVTRLREHVAHRATIAGVTELFRKCGLEVKRVVERSATMRFLNGSALLNHYFIKLGFLPAWKSVAGDNPEPLFRQLLATLDAGAAVAGELRLTIPMAYIEARHS